MGSAMLVVLLGAVGALAATEPCQSGKHTAGGECCEECQPGEGVVQPCGVTQTVCAPCIDSETYSETYSLTEACLPCTQCTGLLRMQAPCTDTNDAVCVCAYDYYRNELTGQCQRCTVCPQGQGVLEKCSYQSDTLCEECPEDTFSDQESSLDPCMPCTICEEDVEIEQEACTSTSDTVCRELNPRFSSTLSSSSLGPTPYSVEDITSSIDDDQTTPAMDIVTTATSPQFIGKGLNENLIPIYCSILAAVVVGLVAYIVFKRWNSCKQNKQGNNNRTVNQTPSPEGEKLHSDSGISVDSQSLQEQQQQQQSQSQTQVVKTDGGSYPSLPPHKQEEVEKLLNVGAQEETDWCSLAGLLGYEEEHINTFRQEEHPVRALLSDWASKDCATLDALCTALRKMKREDIAESLRPEPTATSMV
ncbi:tumor necrosis factor receptor superfamily member 16 isoform X1 [Lepisosteus oculatus]|uniref:Nerve growth factor receptor a (TNFR superfamily, member 16) n=1 Tax=Lepisosteus oculatus TaxID=7918 RepID=W5N119_LEPOC|nr:PREDICTED: tumor necrosis factor receptor superfamily member 16 [Lepisosteus oculatus]